MERVCEYCCESRPTVYCQADSARLCLCCDSNVHSANSVSNAHCRAPLCEACGTEPASVNCLDHPLFMCANCDFNLHINEEQKTIQHQKRVMSNYYGCPSAKDFAELWGYDFNQLQNEAHNSSSQGLALSGTTSAIPPPVCGARTSSGSTNLNREVFDNNRLLQDNRFVQQQILNLDKLQYAERNNHSSWSSGQVRAALYNGGNNAPGQPCDDLLHNRLYLQGLGADLPLPQQSGSLNHHEIHVLSFTFPFSQLEHLTSTSSAGIAFQLHGDPCSQLWSQNMQDLGICEEIDCSEFRDGLSIPDVDLTFQNYEDLFGDDHQTRDNLALETSSNTKKMNSFALDKLDTGFP